MSNKRAIKITVLIVAFACVAVALAIGFASCNPDFYSTEQHMGRISKRVQERFIDTGQYQSYSVYPLYDENDEVSHFLVEFEPSWHMVVEPQDALPLLFKRMYVCNDLDGYSRWYRYRETLSVPCYDESIHWEWKDEINYPHYSEQVEKWVETDSAGEIINRAESPYKAAGVEDDEKLFLIEGKEMFIPAVQRDGMYLNLVSMELYDLNELISGEHIPGIYMGFPPDANNL
ncbi:MAG: hypothetical protein U0M04_07175 [Christensenellales bacterium]|nr:hypothetical protein [Christensenellales bacterium]